MNKNISTVFFLISFFFYNSKIYKVDIHFHTHTTNVELSCDVSNLLSCSHPCK